VRYLNALASSLLLLAAFSVSVPSANASVAASPGFSISSLAAPSTFSEGDNAACTAPEPGLEFPTCDAYEVTAANTGKLETKGEVFVSDTVPPGLEIKEVRLFMVGAGPVIDGEDWNYPHQSGYEDCVTTGQAVSCHFEEEHNGVPTRLAPDWALKLQIFVKVKAGASFAEPCPPGFAASTGCVSNKAKIEGGGAPSVETGEPLSRANLVNGPGPAFGFSGFALDAYGSGGALDSQAGDHPYELATTIYMNTEFRIGPESKFEASGVQDPRDIVVDLPVGFVGSVNAAPQCTFAQLGKHTPVFPESSGCPADTIVGHIQTEPNDFAKIEGPLYNMTPERGEPAEFAYLDLLDGIHVLYTRVVPTPKGYVLQTISPEIPQLGLRAISIVFYGVPAERDNTGNQAIPFFTNPTDCAGEEPTATVYMDSWQNPARIDSQSMPVNLEEEVGGKKVWAKAESKSPAVTGCNALQFPAAVEAQPTSRESDKPTGLNFSIKLPQTEVFGVPGTPTLKKIVTKLPEGLTVNPAAGDGLEACSIAQIGWLGPGGPNGEPLPNNGRLNFNEAPPACPEASKIGELTLETPLLPQGTKVQGEMFVAAQNENPFNVTLAAYVVVHDPTTGILIKIAGEFLPDPHTGQLTAVFDENPNLPFSNLELHFFGGPRAELATPERCGTFTTATELFPYSFEKGELPTEAFNSFGIDEACPGGFSPAFTAGSQNLQAGAYTPFVVSFERHDTDEELSGLSVTLPPGLLADVGSVPLCGEAQAKAGTCPESSQVGTVETGVGPGPDPLFVGGKAYLTGPYNGGPYGLSVVVPALIGNPAHPTYNFGTVVVRQSIRINPYTAQVTDVSDPFPKIIDGIPLRMRRVDVTLNREGFTFNPTNCSKLAFNGSITGSPLGATTSLTGPYNIGYATQTGATSQFTTPFEVTNCQHLKFTPRFAVSTNGKTSKAFGASLTAKLTEPGEAQGGQANIAKVKVALPKQLPSRLTTLQKACTDKQFESNPAGCPKESMIGYATVHTPILSAPPPGRDANLSGPAIFVSHGGEAFPSLTMVLQGNGVTIDLVGTTFISKAGVTSTTFKTVPDTPFSTFELTLPEGKYSALAANGSLCNAAGKLSMPTEFVAQNGAAIHETTPISVTGCKKTLTRSEKLKAVLAVCHKQDKNKGRREACEKTARKRYAQAQKAKKGGKL
jgi:hypothetical protein